MITDGFNRVQLKIDKAVSKGLEDETPYGQHLIKGLLSSLSDRIKAKYNESMEGPGRKHLATYKLADMTPEVAAWFTLRGAVSGVSRGGISLQFLAKEIGRAIQDELWWGSFKEAFPEHYKGTLRFLRSSSHVTRDKRKKVMAHAARKHGSPPPDWSTPDCVHVGTYLLDCLLEVAGDAFELTTEDTRGKKGKKPMHVIVGTPDLVDWILRSQHDWASMRPDRLPLIEPPKNWESIRGGGYHHYRLQRPFVKGRPAKAHLKRLEDTPMPLMYTGVNALQATRWTIDGFTLEIASEALQRGLEIKGLPIVGDVRGRLPPKPLGYNGNLPRSQRWAGVPPEERKKYKRIVREIYHKHKKAVSQSLGAISAITSARAVLGEREIFFEYRVDFRGRIYPSGEALHPQGTDLAKSLLRFAESKPLGERGAWWLAVHVANCFGIDKVSLEERVEWTRTNSARLARMAADPFADLWWTEAEDPWLFLQAAAEWKGFVDEGPSFESSIPITIDGSCNGIQHLAAMSRDAVAGAEVNLVPGPAPRDIYRRVGDQLLDGLRDEVAGKVTYPPPKKAPKRRPDPDWTDVVWARTWLDFLKDKKVRQLTKRPVMVQPYGGTMASCEDYIRAWLDELVEKGTHGPWGKNTGIAARWLSRRLWAAMRQVITGPRVIMEWFQDLAKVLGSANQSFVLTLPTGFVTEQRYPDLRDRRIETMMGETIYTLMIYQENEDRVDRMKMRNSVAPNIIHAFDAACLVLTIVACLAEGITSLSANHDCYGTLAADMDRLAFHTRDQFVSVYLNNVLEDIRSQVLLQLPEKYHAEVPPTPALGDLHLPGVMNSPFFFA